MAGLIWVIIVLLAIAWFFGVFTVNVGWWVNLLLVIALLGILYQLVIQPLLLTRSRAHGHHDVHDVHHDVDDHEL